MYSCWNVLYSQFSLLGCGILYKVSPAGVCYIPQKPLLGCAIHYKVLSAGTSVGCAFAQPYTLVDNSECPWTMSYIYYLEYCTIQQGRTLWSIAHSSSGEPYGVLHAPAERTLSSIAHSSSGEPCGVLHTRSLLVSAILFTPHCFHCEGMQGRSLRGREVDSQTTATDQSVTKYYCEKRVMKRKLGLIQIHYIKLILFSFHFSLLCLILQAP